MRRWPEPADLAGETPGEAVRQWDRLGYPRRALRLHACAVAVVDQHAGRVPESDADLRALPGVGEYTAAAVRAFAFGRRSVVLDTNVRRVLARFAGGQEHPAPSLSVAERSRAEAMVPAGDTEAARAQWQALVELMGAPAWATDPGFLGHAGRREQAETLLLAARDAARLHGATPWIVRSQAGLDDLQASSS